MLPSESHLENGLGRWVQDCNSKERMTTYGDATQTDACLCSSALNDRTTVLCHQPSPRLRLWRLDTGRGGADSASQMLGKYELNGPSHPQALDHCW